MTDDRSIEIDHQKPSLTDNDAEHDATACSSPEMAASKFELAIRTLTGRGELVPLD